MAKKENPVPPWGNHFGVAVRTGFRRTDESTGRTIEMFLCPNGGNGRRADQSYAFFEEAGGDSVECHVCATRHPVIDFFDARARGFIVVDSAGESGARDGIVATATEMAEAIRRAARPKRGVARAKAMPR